MHLRSMIGSLLLALLVLGTRAWAQNHKAAQPKGSVEAFYIGTVSGRPSAEHHGLLAVDGKLVLLAQELFAPV